MSERIRVPFGEAGCYHVVSRVAGGEFLLGDREKEFLRRLMWRVAEFSGVRIVTYAILSNHFHLVVRVPAPDRISDDELVRRYSVLYPKPSPWNRLTAERLGQILRAGGDPAEAWRKALQRRMHDLSWFVRTLKQRFSRWYNLSHGRIGTLWAERFRSVLVEEGRALQVVSAYVDLNPVRAGMVEDPKEYRFCGYAEMCAGSRKARDGLSSLGLRSAEYPRLLFGAGSKPKEGGAWIQREAALRVLEKENGRLPLSTLLRLRVRYLTDGRMLGSPEFVVRMSGDPLRENRKAKMSPYRLAGADWGGLSIPRGMYREVFR